MLSGLVLHLPYARGAREMRGWADAKSFYLRRAARLLPLYYLNLVVMMTFAVPPRLDAAGLEEIALVGTFTFPFTLRHWMPRFNWVFWSLGIEVWLSVLFPLLLVVLRRLGDAKRLLLAAALLALGVRIAAVVTDAFLLPGGPYLDALKDSVLGRIDDFVFGMVLAELVVDRQFLKARRIAWLGPAGALAVFAGCAAWDLHALGTIARDHVPLFNLVVDGGFFCFTLGAIGSRGLLHRVLASGPLQVPGKMCYSLYVWHGVATVPLLGPRLDAAHLALYLLLVGVISSLTYRFVEFPAERDVRALFRAS
jgi:peptidoglycan/LPS O-acetylase OafA/YrhL